jgi:SET domain-containing protein
MTNRPKLPITKVLQMRSSRIHGKGVFARVPIPAGVRLIEYRGKRITNAEADATYPEDPDVPYHTFLFAIDGDVVIDAGRGGNMARWINHSCDPNCDAVVEDGRVWIQSTRDIAPGEELTYDYRFMLDERHTPALKKRYACICGSPNCRGTILAKKR